MAAFGQRGQTVERSDRVGQVWEQVSFVGPDPCYVFLVVGLPGTHPSRSHPIVLLWAYEGSTQRIGIPSSAHEPVVGSWDEQPNTRRLG